ncbi:TetR/AcrR family transcriptional regulator [Massilia antarctica]|uniref:TetR/AcrR family transcriptional regulator n=1 Tax=Massilia antarctica TaxID=2765360 RepID=UPI0006BB9283|nr:TetR/AcrR family transcriptional regulator [Massilia sp. H27-R4]MCY0914249.1 TetR/AcrR family transcriptional regulator [Massilia sp. H27-R4]CUI08658.1 Transcriptional regulator, TetR family [Janthinobacterium sp. CG23_2]CUU32444.1 Transcriptional regulator, TetR family [Janthinobacterium sp. CG23_2]
MSRIEQKALTRQRILDAAGKGFREGGFGGIGIDGLAKQAGVTSGAFYVHFSSKEEAFTQSVVAGIVGLRDAVAALRADHGEQWVAIFIDFYLGEKRTCGLADSCALQSLVPEVGRAGAPVRAALQGHLEALVQAVADGLPPGKLGDQQGRAWALLSMLSGAVSLARALSDKAVSASMAAMVKKAALALALSVSDE